MEAFLSALDPYVGNCIPNIVGTPLVIHTLFVVQGGSQFMAIRERQCPETRRLYSLGTTEAL